MQRPVPNKMLILMLGKILKKMMKSKFLLSLVALSSILMLRCGSGKNEKNDAELNVPVELKDTAVLQADEAGALDKLNSVIDSTKK